MKNNLVAFIFLFLLSGSVAACPWGFTEGTVMRFFYEFKDVSDGELKGVRVGWAGSELLAYLESQEVRNVQPVAVNNLYVGPDCLEELDRIPSDIELVVVGENQKQMASVSVRASVIVKVTQFSSSPLGFREGDSLKAFVKKSRGYLGDGTISGVRSAHPCEGSCALEVGETLFSSESIAFEFVPQDDNGYVTVYFVSGAVTRITYLRQRLKGEGVF